MPFVQDPGAIIFIHSVVGTCNTINFTIDISSEAMPVISPGE